ncbi:MAG: hypothetical protein HGA37_11450, partial [Lentimicrobium sp.]|nr:hypothetical protein [Lentimicrobium sp.]
MKIFNAVVMLLVFFGSTANAQVNRCSYLPPRQADNWLLYQDVNLQFDESGPTVIPLENNIRYFASASISDSAGNLVLFTDGLAVYNKDYEVISYGNLTGYALQNQMALIVPNPVLKQMYYIFTTDNPYENPGFNMSRVDMTFNENKGGVMEMNTPLLAKSAMMLTGVQNRDTTGYWVLTHDIGNNEFIPFLVTSSGVETKSPVAAGPVINTGLEDGLGGIKISPKGDKLAMVAFGASLIELFNFDNSTGAITHWLSIATPFNALGTGPSFLQFSPDGSKLYVTIFNKSSFAGRLYQFDLSLDDADISNSAVWLNDDPGFNDSKLSAMQLARDGKIYMSSISSGFLNVIENPNRPGKFCNYKRDVYPLNTTLRYCMPNFIKETFDE